MTVTATAAPGVAVRAVRWGSRSAFFALVVLSPFRARIDLVARRTVPVYGDFTDFLLSASDIALLATLTLWAIGLALQHRRPSIGPLFVAWPVAALLGIAAIGIPFSVDPALAAYNTVRFVVLAALALYVINEVDSLRRLALPVGVMVTVQAIVAIGQVVEQHWLSLSRLGEHFLYPQLGVSVVTTKSGMRVLRAYGLTDHPNILGGVMAFGVLVLAGAFVSRRRETAHAPAADAALADAAAGLVLVVIALGAAGAFVSFSRASWIGIVTGFIVLAVVVLLGRDRRSIALVGVAGVAVVLGVAPFIAPYHNVLSARTDVSGNISTEARAINEREALTRTVGHIVGDNPVLGVGIGTLPLAMEKAYPAYRYDYQPAPTVFLDVTAETGVFGGTAYLVLAAAPWVALIRRRRRATAELAAASALLAAVTVAGLFDYYPWTYAPGRLWSWLILGLWAAAYQRAGRAERAERAERTEDDVTAPAAVADV